MPGMLWGKVKRSPHAHARIVKIDTSKAEKLLGVARSSPAADFPNIPNEEAFVGEGPMNFRDLSRNWPGARQALYDGHAVAAWRPIAGDRREAIDLIEVEYEVCRTSSTSRRRWRRMRRPARRSVPRGSNQSRPSVQHRQEDHLHQGRHRQGLR